MASTEKPLRGEIWLVSLGAARKGEPGKNRPAIVVSDDGLLTGVEDELIVVVPLSGSRAPSRLRPGIEPGNGLEVESAALPRALRSISRRRLLKRLGAIDRADLEQIEESLRVVLALDAGAAGAV
jgi:mRNA interferase MazF